MKIKKLIKNTIDFIWKDIPHRFSTYLLCIYSIVFLGFLVAIPEATHPFLYGLNNGAGDMLYLILSVSFPFAIGTFIVYIFVFIIENKKKRIKNYKFLQNNLVKTIILLLYLFFYIPVFNVLAAILL